MSNKTWSKLLKVFNWLMLVFDFLLIFTSLPLLLAGYHNHYIKASLMLAICSLCECGAEFYSNHRERLIAQHKLTKDETDLYINLFIVVTSIMVMGLAMYIYFLIK